MNIFFLLTNITILLMLEMKDYCYDCTKIFLSELV